jgi:hypothetical protein
MRSVHRRESLGVQEDASHIFQFPFPGKGDSAASSCVGRSLVDLGFRAHLFPDRLAQPAERYPQLAMDTHPRPAQRSFDHSGTIYRRRPSGIAFRPPSAARCFRAKPQPIDRTGGDEDNAQSANPPEDRPSPRALRVQQCDLWVARLENGVACSFWTLCGGGVLKTVDHAVSLDKKIEIGDMAAPRDRFFRAHALL